jgi:prevent-host-death family protein
MAARVGVRELRQNLSVYLRRVKAGESLEVTERGRPVARLEPVSEASDVIERLERKGLIAKRATRSPAEIPTFPRVRAARPSKEILDELSEDRI